MAYEAGYAVEEKLMPHLGMTQRPLLAIGIYRTAQVITAHDLSRCLTPSHGMDDFWLYGVRPNITPREYARHFATIKEYIKAGDVYQINYCFRLDFLMRGNAASLFNALVARQAVAYAAFLKNKGKCVLSLSPEMFFDQTRDRITMKPMKGTLLKTGNRRRDRAALRRFRVSEKDRAENLMIVDLIRNDLSRICTPDSVKVPALFTAEHYGTLYQMTSTITGDIKHRTPLVDIVKALFPSGSVTGAPKIRAMEIIREVEQGPRGIYTGAIGFIAPRRKHMLFNIPIRTAVIDTRTGAGSLGIGSGIVADSIVRSEYRECVGKARFLTGLAKKYALIETMLFTTGRGIAHLDEHIERLQKSADFFTIAFDARSLRKSLAQHVKLFKMRLQGRIRVLLDTQGKWTITIDPLLPAKDTHHWVRLSTVRTDPRNIFWYHKTTNRNLYDQEYRSAVQHGYFDTIFANIHGEITEGCITNLFVKKNGIYYTSPIRCGLLPGIYRGLLLKKNPRHYKEKILMLRDLKTADEIMLCNSVRGEVVVQLR